MINGVDLIKLTIYKVMIELYKNLPTDKNEEICEYFAGASVNEIFGCHNEMSLKTYNENSAFIDDGLKKLSTEYPDLKQPITDSLRVYVQANHMLGSKIMKDIDFIMELFKKSEDRGLFRKGGEPPNPLTYLDMTKRIARQYDIII